MNDSPEPLMPDNLAVVEPASETPPRRGWTALSWAVIVATVCFVIGVRLLPAAAEKQAAVAGRIDLKVMRAQVQFLVALHDLKLGTTPKDLYTQIEGIAAHDPARQLRLSAVAAELVGPKQALELLDQMQQDPTHLTDDERRLSDVLRRLYVDHERGRILQPSLPDQDVSLLKQQLGWFGLLALYPAVPDERLQTEATAAGGRGPELLDQYRAGRQDVVGAATHTLVVFVVVIVGVLTLLLLGVVALPLFVLLWSTRGVRVGLDTGSPYGGIYAETFALWMAFYVALMIGSEWLLHDILSVVVRGCITMPLSLLVVAWPVLRGVPWRQVRQDIGWTFGRVPPAEPVFGWLCYIINLPLVVAGFIVTVVAASIAAALTQPAGGEATAPTHPVLEQLSHPDWPSLVLFFMLLSVIAPIIEETMFRGILHRHLREVLFVRHPLLGGISTSLIVNFIFAAVHPQGLLFIPVLMALACGFSLAREWRGTLIPGMVAHGTNNFLAGMLGVLLLTR